MIVTSNVLVLYTMKNIFQSDNFLITVCVLTWRAQKMRSTTSSEGPRLVRIAVPYAQTRVTIAKHRSFREACMLRATEP